MRYALKIISPAGLAFLLSAILLVSCGKYPHPNGEPPEDNVLYVVSCMDAYRKQAAQNPDMELIDLETAIEGVIFDIRYATPNNFTGETVYTLPKAYARKPVSEALKKIQEALVVHNLGTAWLYPLPNRMVAL